MVPERSASINLDGSAPDGIAIAIDVKRAVGGADDDRDRSARAALRLPVVVITSEWAQHLRRKIFRREHQSGIRCEMRHGRFAIAHYNGAALRRRTKKQLRETVRQANASVAGRVTGKIARVHGNSSPGEPLHVWHRRVVVCFRVMLLLFLEDGENAARGGVTFRARAHGCTAAEGAVAINMHGLLWDAHKHHERTARRELRFPPILARLDCACRFSGWRAFSMSRRLLHRLHGGEHSDGKSEDFQEFHEMVRDVNSDESGKLPILNKTFVPYRPARTISRECSSSMRSRDHVLHDLTACGLQWPHSAAGQEPHTFILIAAVKNVDAVARDRVMECGAGVFGNKSEECFPPRIIGIMEHLSPKLL